MNIKYGNLRSMDMVICAGKSPFAAVTRTVTSGFKNIRNYAIAVHTGIVMDWKGQKFCLEMTEKGIELNTFNKYLKEGGRRWIIDIVRSSVYDNPGRLKAAEERAVHAYRRSIEYDWKGLVEFVFSRVQDNKKRMYCSELYYQLTCRDIEYPTRFAERVSPYDLQLCSWFQPVEWEG